MKKNQIIFKKMPFLLIVSNNLNKSFKIMDFPLSFVYKIYLLNSNNSDNNPIKII